MHCSLRSKERNQAIHNNILLIVLVFSLILFSNISCNKVKEIPSFEKSLFYALPEGGISLYDFSKNKEIRLTNDLDYYPMPLRDGETILFLRLKGGYTGKGKERKSKIDTYVYSYNTKRGRERQIVKLKDFSPNRDLKDSCFFVDNGKYLLVLSYSRQSKIISLETGERVDLSMLDFLPEVNQYDSKGEKIFLRLRQYPRRDIFKNPSVITCPESLEAILMMDKDFNFKQVFGIPKDKMFSSTIYGFSYSEDLNILAFSFDKKIYLLKDNHTKELAAGIHPVFLKKNVIQKPLLKFPLINLSFVYQTKINTSEEVIFLCSKNYISLLNKKSLSYHLLTIYDAVSGSTLKDYDKAYLFSNLELIGKLSFNDLLILVSYKERDPNAGPENILAVSESIDTINFFSLTYGKVENKFSIPGREGISIEFTDLNKDGKIEIVVQYAASNFKCEERFKIAGRALIWKDVYALSEKNEYEIANGRFPSIYEELLRQLEPLYSNALAAKRLKQPILCDDDLDKLSQLIRDAKQIVSYYR